MRAPITIVGAGLGGLTLACVLSSHGIASTIYEAEHDENDRGQGGQLDIHFDTGQRALEAAGLTDEFRAIINVGGQANRILDEHGTVLFAEADDGLGGRPEVLRGDLRHILLDALPEETVQWGHKVTEVRADGRDRHVLSFANGSTATTDLLVGADGTWSKIRPLVSSAKPTYTGTTYIETYLRDADQRHPASALAVGEGKMYAPSPGKIISAHREAGNVLHAYIQLSRAAEWFADIDFADAASTRARIAAEFDGWAPALTALITDSDTPPIQRTIYSLPDDHRWARVPGVTLLGDAAHVTRPSGDGANLAMLDGADLAAAIIAQPGDLDAALHDYEQALFPRSHAAADHAHLVHHVLIGDQTPQLLVDFFTGNLETTDR